MSMKVEVFSTPGCSACARSREALQAVVASFGQDKVTWREVNVIDEIDYAVALGVMVPPSIAIDGELVFPTLPTANTLKDELTRRLERRGKP
jgi:glutaredoxin